MGKLPKLTAREAERMLLKSGYEMIRSRGNHRIYKKGNKRTIVPFHPGKILHPKVIAQVIKFVES